MTQSDSRTRQCRVLILGGGFGGAYAARRLGQTLGKRHDVEVVMICRENYLLFTPMLHEVAAGDLYPPDIVEPLRTRLHGVHFMQGEVIDVDLQARVVRYAAGSLRRRQEITYDYLLLALGSETNYFGMEGLLRAPPHLRRLATPRCCGTEWLRCWRMPRPRRMKRCVGG